MAPTPKLPPFGDDIGGGVMRRPGPPPAHVPKPKPSPGGIEDQGGSSRGGLGDPKYGARPTGGRSVAMIGAPASGPRPFDAFVQRTVASTQGQRANATRARVTVAQRQAAAQVSQQQLKAPKGY